MAKTYTYDPLKINDNGINQMRFELGDTMTEGGEETCPLCDEEYTLILREMKQNQKNWKYAKMKCLKAIVMKLAYEVNYTADGLHISLNERYKRWKEILDKMEKSHQIPVSTTPIGNKVRDKGHYFYLGMQNNPYIK